MLNYDVISSWQTVFSTVGWVPLLSRVLYLVTMLSISMWITCAYILMVHLRCIRVHYFESVVEHLHSFFFSLVYLHNCVNVQMDFNIWFLSRIYFRLKVWTSKFFHFNCNQALYRDIFMYLLSINIGLTFIILWNQYVLPWNFVI